MTSETTITFDDGASTTLTQWGQSGPVILCVHGLTSGRIGWQRFAKTFENSFRVFAYDQRGHGDSASYTTDMTAERVARDFVNVASALGEPIHLAVGQSWGGAVVIGASPRADVHRVVAVDPALRQLSATWYDEYLEDLQPVFALHGSERDAYLRSEYAALHPLDLEAKVFAMRHMRREGLMNVREQNPPERWNLLRDVDTFPLPLLLALADPSESIIAAPDFKALQETRNPMVRVQVFEGGTHSLHRSHFDEFVAAVESFLEVSERMV